MHALLETILGNGVVEVPRPIGFDESGREVLTHLPGTILDEASPSIRWSGTILEEAGQLLRRLHDASQTLELNGREWRTAAHEPIEVVCHNDFAPYNLLVQGDRLTGVIDFDMASPGPRIWDLAYLAYRLVPFAEDASHERLDTPEGRLDRLRHLIDAYGITYDVSAVLAVAVDRLAELADFTDARAAETGRADLVEHAAMYRRDASRLRTLTN